MRFLLVNLADEFRTHQSQGLWLPWWFAQVAVFHTVSWKLKNSSPSYATLNGKVRPKSEIYAAGAAKGEHAKN